MLIKIALNGARAKSEHPHIPQSLQEIHQEVSELYKRGNNVFHIHCYDVAGNESLSSSDVTKLITTIKEVSKDIKIGISSGDWIEPNITKRLEHIRSWQICPDFISVNFIEDNVTDVVQALIEKGVYIEAGLDTLEAANRFIESPYVSSCYRILIETDEVDMERTINTIEGIEELLDQHNIKTPRLLHGFNKTAWPVLRLAKEKGYDTRIGMEDTLYFENGRRAKNNIELFEEAERLLI
ncbi:3-keto-5-aminohexanoate cleavage protein [Spirochaeta cellobiosiphila]|uniref:3-keto-5-aminohexanoate cleavage protein n=1 Tax=Spirochaeta cellobiosiphila TaxID=504483 RepID=UPI000417CAB3|nr:3-keto-5-aminohexanoate cleavage protein [Spirochaeta cellobiosiphila]